MNITTHLISFRPSRIIQLTCLTLALFGIAAIAAPAKAHAADCDDNAIIKCGASTASQFINKVRDNDSLNGHHDLKAVYDHYGLEPADYDRFVAYAKPGLAYRDGRIVVEGRTVATATKSIGRLASYQGSGYFATTIAGRTYYGNVNDRAFGQGTNSLPVLVLFNDRGVMEFAVLTGCGNPIYGNPEVPTYSCNKLQKKAVANSPGTYTFTTDTTISNGAKIEKLVYDFGDGTRPVVVTNPNQSVTHTYKADGSYTARVSVYVNLPGDTTTVVKSADCMTTVNVALPYYQCVSLAATAVSGSRYKYKFVATGKVGNGAHITSAEFIFGDGKTQTVQISSGQVVTATYTYPQKDEAYTARVKLSVEYPGGKAVVTSPACTAKIAINVPYYSCVKLEGSILDDARHQYQFRAVADFGNGAKFNSVDFDFGDGSVTKDVKPTGTTATVKHTYVPGNYRATATLHFSVGSAAHTVTCSAVITPNQPPTPECKPGIPEGSALCSTCEDTQTPGKDANCAVSELPSTGAGSVIALFGAAVVAGFFLFRQFIAPRILAAEGATPIDGPPAVEADLHFEEVAEHTQHAPHAHHASHPHAAHQANHHKPHRFRPQD